MGLSLKRIAKYAPRTPRASVAVDSLLLLPDDRSVSVTIKNISVEGFMGEADADLEPETWFGIVIPGHGIVRAKVCWSEAGAIGAQFGRPLDPKQLEEWAPEDSRTRGFLDARVLKAPFCSFGS